MANWSGRPRRLLTSAPLQIRTCGITASGSSDYGFAVQASPDRYPPTFRLHASASTVSRRVSFRRFRNPALLFPPPAPTGGSSPASSVLLKRSDARRPSRSAPFRSPSGTTDYCESRGGGELPLAGSSSVLMPVPQSSAFDSHSWRRAGSPRFLGNPFAHMPCSSTPADRIRQAIATHPMLPSARLTASAPRSVTFRGSITQPVRSLSTLHGSDYSDSNTAQDSLPADGHS